MPQKISHLGIAVHSIAEAAKFYHLLGLEIESTEVVESQQVKVAFITVGDVRLELLEPTSAESPVAKFLENKGEGIHHIALEVNDLTGKLSSLEKSGVRLIDAKPRPGAHNARIAFLHPKSSHGVLLELCEESH